MAILPKIKLTDTTQYVATPICLGQGLGLSLGLGLGLGLVWGWVWVWVWVRVWVSLWAWVWVWVWVWVSLGFGPPTYANSCGFVWVCAPDVKHHAQLDNSWSQIMPN